MDRKVLSGSVFIHTILFFISLFAPYDLSAQAFPPDTQLSKDQIPTRKPLSKQGLPKLETPLSELYLNRNQPAKLSPDTVHQLKQYLVDDSVQVVVVMNEEQHIPSMKEFLQFIGARVVAEFATRIEVVVPVAKLQELSEREGVLYIRRPLPVFPIDTNSQNPSVEPAAYTGTNVTQGVVASNANLWHANNYTGAGVRVGILDSFKDWDTAQSLGELPAALYYYGALGVDSRHGTAVAEVIYDMAPGARLTLSTPSSVTQMASFITGLAQSNHTIISSSMGYYLDEPGDGVGTVSSAINTATDTYGVVYCQAAGNQAQYHWDGYFSDPDADGYHDFASGVEINVLNAGSSIPAGYPINLFLRWNDWPVSDQDYDLYLVSWNGASWDVVTASENWQNGSVPPTESISIPAPSTRAYGFAIYKYSATGNHVLDIMGHNAPSFTYNQPNRSLIDAATAERSFSVAAVDVTTYDRESYSSIGPTHGPGGALSGGIAKPRIAAFANVDTWSYGPGVFNGTSSATPHVAGAAALVRQAFPFFTPTQVKHFLEDGAIDQGAAGYDYLYGAGRLNLGSSPPPRKEAFPWNLFLPAIMKGRSAPAPFIAYWGAGSDVCCTTSSAAYSLTLGGVTKSSILASCTADPTWEGWAGTTPGAKVFTWRLVSSGCGSYQGSFAYTLAQNLYHLFVLGWNGSSFTITVYTGTSAAAANTLSGLDAFGLSAISADAWERADEIVLDVPPQSAEMPKGIMKATN